MTSPETAPESLPPGETFDPTKQFTTRDGRKVMYLRTYSSGPRKGHVGSVNSIRLSWYLNGRYRDDGVETNDDLVNVPHPPPVSVPASKCDRPDQADAAVADEKVERGFLCVSRWAGNTLKRSDIRTILEAALSGVPEGATTRESRS